MPPVKQHPPAKKRQPLAKLNRSSGLIDSLNLVKNKVVNRTELVEMTAQYTTDSVEKKPKTYSFAGRLTIVVAVVGVVVYMLRDILVKFTPPQGSIKYDVQDRGWNKIIDKSTGEIEDSDCEILVFDHDILSKMLKGNGKGVGKDDNILLSSPFIIKGRAMQSWPSFQTWTTDYFLQEFGNGTVTVGSPVEITQGPYSQVARSPTLCAI